MNEHNLFAAAISIADTQERARYLDSKCAGQPDLRKRMDRLCDANFKSNPLLDQLPTEAVPYSTTEAAGAVIAGRYKLLQKIGEGGMGSVWMADQTEPVKRRVAIKLIQVDRSNSKSVLSRFEAEQQAIALMDHPNIAKLLDAGTNDDGAPFFAMELVKGIPLHEYCDKHSLGIRERLQLFVQICSGVQHAHQKGIIHRDLKPTNILVENHDNKPVPKVIDFGLAKAASGIRLSENTLFTAFGNVIGTPLYMAPEQANFNAVDIDTRADVYALGVILYELLTGTTPIIRDTMKKVALDEVLKLVREQEAPTPSSRLSTTDSAPSVAANRQMEPQILSRFVRGDLDWIVMKALSKERDRRYETAIGFARDIEHFLANEPVSAGPPGAVYRMRKFVQRNRGTVIAASLVLLALLAGIAGTAWQAIRAERARAEETRQRGRAEKALARTADVLDTMVSEVTGDSLATQKQISAEQKKFLSEVLTYYEEFARENSDDEESRARAAQAAFRVVRIESRMGRKEEGELACRRATALYEKLATDFPASPNYREGLAASYQSQGLLLRHLGNMTESEAAILKGLDIQKKLCADFPTETRYREQTARSHQCLARLMFDQGNGEEAENQNRKALAIQEKLAEEFPFVPDYRQDLANSYDILGLVQEGLGKVAEAEEPFRKGLALEEKLASEFPGVPDYRQNSANSHNSLGTVLVAIGKKAEAEEHFRKGLALQEKLATEFPGVPDYRQNLAVSHNNLGSLLLDLGETSEAKAQLREALAVQEKLAEDFPVVPSYRIALAASYGNFGNLELDRGAPSDSLAWFSKAINTLTAIHENEPREVTVRMFLRTCHENRAIAFDRLKQYEEAIQAWGKAIDLSPIEELPGLRVAQAISRLQAGQVAEAMAEVAELVKSPDGPADRWYDFACFYSIASDKVPDKKDEYSQRAVELLQQAVDAGYNDAAHMQQDTDLDPLRDHEDFKALLAELEKYALENKSGPEQ